MTLSLLLGALDAVGAGYLLWYARRRQRGSKEPLAVVALMLLIVAGCLFVVAWKAAHPSLRPQTHQAVPSLGIAAALHRPVGPARPVACQARAG